MITLQTLNEAAALAARHFGEIPRYHHPLAREAALTGQAYRLGSILTLTPDGRIGFGHLPSIGPIEAAAVRLRLQPDADPVLRRRWREYAEWQGPWTQEVPPAATTRIHFQGRLWTVEEWDLRCAALVRDGIERGLVFTHSALSRLGSHRLENGESPLQAGHL